MFDVILAMTKNNGIGFNGSLPWKCKEELNIFKDITMNSVLVIGRKTVETLPYLSGRTIWCLTKQKELDTTSYKNTVIFIYDFDSLINMIELSKKPVFIAGGSQIYNKIFSLYRHKIKHVYLSIMNDNDNVKCDTFIKFNLFDWTVKTKTTYTDFTHYVLSPIISDERQYLNILNDVYNNGSIREGRNGLTKSMFFKTLKFDLTIGFPILTTKKMFWRGIVEELLFFIRGDTDSKKLEDKKINIWKGNTNRNFLDKLGKTERKEGMMGKMYGFQWRFFNGNLDEETGQGSGGIDQLEKIINQIKQNPNSRRILMTDYNPEQVEDGCLYPCHSVILQFYVQEGYLDMFCYNRSSDLFHGLPFNIASSSLLLTLISKITGLKARHFILSLGDAHIYESHYDVVQKQLRRIPYKFPELHIKKELKTIEDIEKLEYNDIILEGYNSYPSLKAKMVE
jgi:thymidylate synthase